MAIQRDTLLGLVFFGGLALVGWATLTLTTLWGEPKERLEIYFEHAQRLRQGDPVYVLGKRLGQVSEVSLTPGGTPAPVRVLALLDAPLALTEGMSIAIREAGLLGGAQVDIDPGRGGAALTPPFLGTVAASPLDKLGEADLAGTLASIKRLFDKLADPRGSIGALLESRAGFDDLEATLQSLRGIVAQVERGEGALGRVIYSQSLADDLATAVQSLREIAAKMNRGEGLVARLLNDPALAQDLAGSLDGLRQLVARAERGEGLLGRVLASEDLADKLDATLAALQSFTAKLDDPNGGLIGALAGDRELLRGARSMVANLDELTTKMNEGRGLLGRLIHDDELGEKLSRLMNQVTGAIEDAREAAPIGTFFQVLAAPF